MKKQPSISGSPSLQDEKDDKGLFSALSSFVPGVFFLLVVALLLVPVIMWVSHNLQEKSKTISNLKLVPTIEADPVDLKSSREFYEESLKASQHISKLNFSGEADFDNSGEGDIDSEDDASTEMVPDTSQMASDVSSESDTASTSGE